MLKKGRKTALLLKPTLSVVEHLELKFVFTATKPWIKAPHFQQRNASMKIQVSSLLLYANLTIKSIKI
jgi:hypothetical protein